MRRLPALTLAAFIPVEARTVARVVRLAHLDPHRGVISPVVAHLMKELTVKQLAAISGITVRTLHHYDEIGLLRPASVGANGYRYYGRAELLRLQRILFHRELGVPLGDDRRAAGAGGRGPGRRAAAASPEAGSRARTLSGVLIETIDRTIADLKGEAHMANADLYQGFSAEKQAGYEAWLIERYGEPMRAGIEHSKQAFAKMSPAEQQAFMVGQGGS